MQDLASIDKETLRRIAQKAEERVDVLVSTTRSVMAIHGTTKITPRVTRDALDVYDGKKSFIDIVQIPNYSPKFSSMSSRKGLHEKWVDFSLEPEEAFRFPAYGIVERDRDIYGSRRGFIKSDIVSYLYYGRDELGEGSQLVVSRHQKSLEYETISFL